MPSQHQAPSVLNALEEQTKTGHLCDVLFYNDSGSVWAHSCVLAGFSPVFDQLFSLNLKNSHHWSLKQPMQIAVNDTSHCTSDNISNCIHCLAQVVKFIYTGHIKPSASHLCHLFSLSDRLRNEELFKICETYRREHSLLVPSEERCGKSIDPQEPHEDEQATTNVPKKDDDDAEREEKGILHSKVKKIHSVFDCSECNFVCKDEKLFEIHGEIFHCNSYKCLHCQHCFKSVLNLLHHIENECKSESSMMCSLCLLQSRSSTEFVSHIREHLSPKPFACSICKRAFNRRSLWLKHTKQHLLNTTHHCPLCESVFKTEAECEKHVKVVHTPKKYVCERCGFVAAFPYLLKKHQLNHRSVLVCDQKDCDFRTSSEAQLIRHRQKHKPEKQVTAERNHECSICKIKFTLNKNLLRHMKIHDRKKKILKCTLCNYETARTDKYSDHIEFKHAGARQAEAEGDCLRDGVMDEQPSSNGGNQDNKQSLGSTDQVYPEHVAKPHCSRESFSVESPFSQKCNTLLMNDEGDISIVDNNERNSVTLRNLGNLTGSITLDEKTGVLTMNNINSGSVFLNETTGELTYINLENDRNRELNYHFNADSVAQGNNFKTPGAPKLSTEITKLDEVTGEIIKVLPTNEDAVAPDQEFDSFDMDINEDSLDGFDDFDEVLFDVFTESDYELEKRNSPQFDHPSTNTNAMPHLDESTGLLTFDENLESRIPEPKEAWSPPFVQQIENNSNGEEAYKLLLDEVTGVLHD